MLISIIRALSIVLKLVFKMFFEGTNPSIRFTPCSDLFVVIVSLRTNKPKEADFNSGRTEMVKITYWAVEVSVHRNRSW